MKLESLISSGQCSVVDVRTPAEFMGAHVAGSVNVPLQEIEGKLQNLKTMKQPLVLCCASGGRSGQATAFLSAHGIECYNAGSWLTVNQYKNQKV